MPLLIPTVIVAIVLVILVNNILKTRDDATWIVNKSLSVSTQA